MARSRLSLNALRTFDAAARHLSFTSAGQELGVSQAAVSTQIRTLESQLDVQLFRRKTRAVELTDQGLTLYRATQAVFARLETAISQIVEDSGAGLTVALTPAFAARWLFPRLSRFRKMCPGLELRLIPSNRLADLFSEEVDVAIRWGKGRWPGLKSELLLHAELTPVCSPKLLNGNPGLAEPGDLKHHRLLHERNTTAWKVWLDRAGVEGVDPSQGPVLGDPSLIDSAAIAGDGVALGRPTMLGHYFAQGLLVQPFEFLLPTSRAYYLVMREGSSQDPRISAFREFLKREVATPGALRFEEDDGRDEAS